MQCPTHAQLHEWLHGDDSTDAKTTDHVADCEDCQRRLGELTDEPLLAAYQDCKKPPLADDVDWQSIRDQVIARPFADGAFTDGEITDGAFTDGEITDGAFLDDEDPPSGRGNSVDTPDKAIGAASESLSIADDSTQPAEDVSRPQPVSVRGVDVPSSVPAGIPTQIGDLRIDRRIGQGGFGEVFLAWDTKTSRTVAVKLLSAKRLDGASRERFFREIRLAARVEAPTVVRVLTAGETDDGVPFFVMDHIEGGALSGWIEGHQDRGSYHPPDMRRIAELIRDAAHGLESIHKVGLIHRDVKPGNILLDKNHQHAKITDFGVARQTTTDTATLTRGTDLVGTVLYMSPEQADDPTAIDARADVYSLGATLFHAVTGQAPFRGTAQAVLSQHSDSVPVPPSILNDDVPRDLETICLKALEKNPARRYSSAQSMADDIGRFLSGEPVMARPISSAGRVWRWCGRHRLLAAMAATSLTLLLALGVGSTIAAWRFSAANESIRVGERNATIAKEQAIRAKEQAIHDRHAAADAERRALRDRTAAVDALSTLVGSLHKELQKDAASIATREKVASAAIHGLKSLSQMQGDRESDRAAMLAHRQIGDILSLQGNEEEGIQEFQESIDIARRLTIDAPDERAAQRELAVGLDHLVVHKLREGNTDIAAEQNEIEAILRGLLVENEEDGSVLKQLIYFHSRELDRIWMERAWEQALQMSDIVLADTERLLALNLESTIPFTLANDVHTRLGRAFMNSGNVEKCFEQFLAAKNTIDRAVHNDPSHAEQRLRAAITDRMLGLFYHKIGLPEKALELYEPSTEFMRARALADPQNLDARENAAGSFQMMAEPLVSLGRYAEALELLEESTASYESVMDATPDNPSVVLAMVQAYGAKADVHMRRSEWNAAYDCCAKSLARLVDKESNLPHSPAYRSAADTATGIQGALDKLLGRQLGRQTPQSATTSSEAMALFLAGRSAVLHSASVEFSDKAKQRIKSINADAKINTIDELMLHVRSLPDLPPPIASSLDSFEARLLSLRAERLANAGKTEDANALIAPAMKRLKRAASALPGQVVFGIYTEFDMHWIRSTDPFLTSPIHAAYQAKVRAVLDMANERPNDKDRQGNQGHAM